MKETELAFAIQPLRQGDILRYDGVDPENSPEFGVIINADCDLANSKIDGTIACLPIYTFRQYLRLFWAPGYLLGEKQRHLKRARDIVDLDEAGTDDLARWLSDERPSIIAEKLSASRNLKAREQSELIGALDRLSDCINLDQNPLVTAAVLFRHEKDPRQYASKQIIAARKAMSDGHLFITELAGMKEVGFVIRLRRIQTFEESKCFKAESDRIAHTSGVDVTAARVARLTSLYQYKLAQLFANQFSRIGLPDETMALSDLAVEDMVSQMTRIEE